MRVLPPAGHHIPLSACFKVFAGKKRLRGSFIDRMYPRSLICLVSSGTAALTLALKSLADSSEKQEVLIPAYSCPSVASAVVRSGMKPVLCDIDPEGFGMRRQGIEALVNEKTAAVIGVHLFGIAQDVDALKELAHSRQIAFIEDACQAFGNVLPKAWGLSDGKNPYAADKKYLGGAGDIGVLSFGRGKPLNLMAGGAVVINNFKYEDAVRRHYESLQLPGAVAGGLHHFLELMVYSLFFHPRMYWIPDGLPWLRLGETVFDDTFTLKKAYPWLTGLASFIRPFSEKDRQYRLELSEIYRKHLEPVRSLFLFLPRQQDGKQVLLRFPLVFRNRLQRDCILAELKENGLGATRMYPVVLSQQQGLDVFLDREKIYPGAVRVSEGILTLPLHSFVSFRDAEKICRIVIKGLKNGNS